MDIVVISYMPLVRPDAVTIAAPYQQYDPENAKEMVKRITNVLENTPSADVEACLWVGDESGQVCPIFVMKNANEVKEHLAEWSEKRIKEWFGFYIDRVEDRYLAMLFPNLDKSIQRFKLMYLDTCEALPPSDAVYNLFFRPLDFISQGLGIFQRIEFQIPDEISVGFLEYSKFDPNRPEDCFQHVEYLDPVPRIRVGQNTVPGSKLNGYLDSYVRQRFDEAK